MTGMRMRRDESLDAGVNGDAWAKNIEKRADFGGDAGDIRPFWLAQEIGDVGDVRQVDHCETRARASRPQDVTGGDNCAIGERESFAGGEAGEVWAALHAEGDSLLREELAALWVERDYVGECD